MWTTRTEMLIGKENCEKLKNSHITIVGLGGVGGYAVVMLARAGVNNFTLIDFDKVEETNINRQIVATTKTIGKFKTEVLKEMLLEINPNCQIQIYTTRLTEDNISSLISKDTDYCIDCIDSVKDKVSLCSYCYFNEIPIISAMGAGNRIDIPEFKVIDLYKTANDGLAKVMRKKLKEKGVKNLEVVAPASPALKNIDGVGSISYYPAMCGCVLSAQVLNKLLKKENL